jgi:hypothetical protein
LGVEASDAWVELGSLMLVGHTAALVAGALPAHSLISLFVMPLGTADRVALALIMLGAAGFGIWLIRRARANYFDLKKSKRVDR